MDLTDRSRTLALAIFELIRSRWQELSEVRSEPIAVVPEPSPEPEPTPLLPEVEALAVAVHDESSVSDETQRPNNPTGRGWLFGARLDLALCPTHGGTFLGAMLEGSFLLTSSGWLRLSFEIGYHNGGGPDFMGHVTSHKVDGAAALLIDRSFDHLRVMTGLRIEAGWAIAKGIADAEDTEESSINGVVLIPSWQTALLIRIASSLWLRLGLDVGYVALGITARAADRYLGGIGGPSLATSVGLVLVL